MSHDAPGTDNTNAGLSPDPEDLPTEEIGSSGLPGFSAETSDSASGSASEPAACAYCGISNPTCLAKCEDCSRWFCNSAAGLKSSHIVTHLVLAKHRTVSLHELSDYGANTLQCYNCGDHNVFSLGFVSAQAETVLVILCRNPCSIKSSSAYWDTNDWQPLIEDKQLLSWVAEVPSEAEIRRAAKPDMAHIGLLEDAWRMRKPLTIADIDAATAPEPPVAPLPTRFTDGYEYQRSFGPLVKLEDEFNRQEAEALVFRNVHVSWDLGLNRRHLVSFSLPRYEGRLRVSLGDQMLLEHDAEAAGWMGLGYVVKIIDTIGFQVVLELTGAPDVKPGVEESSGGAGGAVPVSQGPPPVDRNTNFTVRLVWNGSVFTRMQAALRKFALDSQSVSGYLYHTLMGHEVEPLLLDRRLPERVSAGMPELNVSQSNAVRAVLQRPLSLIQGPPGTGKTVTSASIVYHLVQLLRREKSAGKSAGKVLVCAPSNVAVDHLAAKLSELPIKLVRLAAKSREDVGGLPPQVALHELVQRNAELGKLSQLKRVAGELSERDDRKFRALLRTEERRLLSEADVVCCTCAGAGDRRLAKFRFPAVLIDESAQATEPECLIPLVKGCRQAVLVGDHQQLGPVVGSKAAAQAGLHRSLFERLIVLGHVPIRLTVQYRMHPKLSAFCSNVFYEGSLQNGVTARNRTLKCAFPWPVADTPMLFWCTRGREELAQNGVSLLNRAEAANVEQTITRLLRGGVAPEQIGVVTPYEGQREYVAQYMQSCGLLGKEVYQRVEVASVDAFQGREKDVVILSCVRSVGRSGIGFLKDPRRLNVALTRARYGLVVVGDAAALVRNELWRQLLLHFRGCGCLVEGPLDALRPAGVPLGRGRRVPEMPMELYGERAEDGDDAASLVSFEGEEEAVASVAESQLGEYVAATKRAGRVVEEDIQSMSTAFASQLGIH